MLLLWLARDPGGFVHDRLGLTPQVWQVPTAWALALAVAAGYSLYTLWAFPFVHEHVFELSRLKLLGIWVAVVSGILEELVFRQMLMDLAASWHWPAAGQVALSAAMFGLAHGVWVALRGELRIAVPVIASTAALGGLLALVYLAAGRNVVPAATAHILINLVIEPWLLLAGVSGRWHPR